MTIPPDIWSKLTEVARQSRENARAEYSGFRVGAAVYGRNGQIFGGCNIENATWGLTVCAERVALWKALSEGVDQFLALVVMADSSELTPPCGACRQIIWEFAGDIPIRMMNLRGEARETSAGTLLPNAFDRRFLGTGHGPPAVK